MTAPLDIAVIGLSLSSSWGNGHATTYRALLRAMAARGHRILFLERDVPWYAANRDLPEPGFCRLGLYEDLPGLARWQDAIAAADAVILGSFVPEGGVIGRLVQTLARGVTGFYDIDTPVTLARLAGGDHEYLAPDLIPGFDLYLSFTGGPMLRRLEQEYGARDARALYCSVDTQAYRPLRVPCRWDLSYLGTYSADRQPILEELLIEPARRAPQLRFVVAGAQYPDGIAWPANVERIAHVPPAGHAAFYAASRYTLNITRADMVAAGFSPSVRLFEAAACGTPVISDRWPGLDGIFRINTEIMLADSADAVHSVLRFQPETMRQAISAAARRRVLAEHSAAQRAATLELFLRDAMARARRPAFALAGGR